MNMQNAARMGRGFLYRRLPGSCRGFWPKKLAGYERRWNLEQCGFTKEGFFILFQEKILGGLQPGTFLELASGDGWVGSLGNWLEVQASGWQVLAWEHRPRVARSFSRGRPRTMLHPGRLTDWLPAQAELSPSGITTRGAREAAGVCRAIRKGLIRPRFVGIWNPSQRPVWYRRLKPEGYRLEMVWNRMEFYRG